MREEEGFSWEIDIDERGRGILLGPCLQANACARKASLGSEDEDLESTNIHGRTEEEESQKNLKEQAEGKEEDKRVHAKNPREYEGQRTQDKHQDFTPNQSPGSLSPDLSN